MIHHATTEDNHWAVGYTGKKILQDSQVLAQLQEAGNQARIPLTPAQARQMAESLLYFADKAEQANAEAIDPAVLDLLAKGLPR